MFIDKRRLSKDEVRRISSALNVLLVLGFIVLLFAFWDTQILKNRHYHTLASQNITKDIEVKAPRGLIVDRNYHRLSENKLNFGLFLVREYSPDIEKSLTTASSILGIDKEIIRKKIKKYDGYPDSFMIPLEKNLPLKKVIYIESRSDELPEFKIEVEPARAYPYHEIGSHIMGYISEMTPAELERKKHDGYKIGDFIGTSGIEKQYESALRGTKGVRTVIRDNLGSIREVVNEIKPLIGNTVVLTIDIKLQEFIEQEFTDYNGTVGVVDLKTGGILAMVSKPNFNPEFFSGVLEQEEWLHLVNDPDRPLNNKFIQGCYSPGSTFKIVVALGALQEKIIDASTVSTCVGVVHIYDRDFHCWQAGGHGSVDLVDALKNSCNVFFYRTGKKMDIDVIVHYATMLGMGGKTGIDLPNEKIGIIPSQEWKQKTRGGTWFPGETISVSIGGGVLNVTPIQSLEMISTVALRGRAPRLHLLQRIESDGKVISEFKPLFNNIPIDKEHFELVIQGLYKVVNDNGTGHAAHIKGIDICGKTGTQQVISKELQNYKTLVKQKRFKPHAWFVSFAPKDNPKIAMVVFIENGGDAGAVAAPLAGKIYRKIFLE